MDANRETLTFAPHEAGYCQQCGQYQDALYLATLSRQGETESMAMCRNCAVQLKDRFDRYNAPMQNVPAPQAAVPSAPAGRGKARATVRSRKPLAVIAVIAVILIAIFGISQMVKNGGGSSSGVRNFAIEGTWKNVGNTSCAQMQVGSITTFDGTHCNVYSPRDTYAFYQSGGEYHLDCTSFFAGDSMCFTVRIIDRDNIELTYTTGTVVRLTRIS